MDGEAGVQPYRVAGQHARAQARGLATRMLVVVGCALLVLLTAGPVLGLRGRALIGVELAAIGAMVVADRFFESQFERWLQGARGEESVGAAARQVGSRLGGWRSKTSR